MTYEILAGAQEHFIINNRTGRLTVAPGVALTVGLSYTLTIKASDGAPETQRRCILLYDYCGRLLLVYSIFKVSGELSLPICVLVIIIVYLVI